MTASPLQATTHSSEGASLPECGLAIRREPRTEAVRIVEYTIFPRVDRDAGPSHGFTRDFAPAGMCLGVEQPEPIGSLLRVNLRGVDGFVESASIARVVWRKATGDRRHWLGLHLISRAAPHG